MRCLTVRQPWAWAIVAGLKSIENRSRRTSHRGPLLIHAGVSRCELKVEIVEGWKLRYGVDRPPDDALVFGAIIGQVDLVDCVPLAELSEPSAWATGPWCWILANPRAIKPQAASGKLGLWEADLE